MANVMVSLAEKYRITGAERARKLTRLERASWRAQARALVTGGFRYSEME